MMPEYVVKAEYRVDKTLVVSVPEGADPLDPASWSEILSEEDDDCVLQDTTSAEPNE